MKYLAIKACFCNEAPYLAEWIAHHLNMGVEHFYLRSHRCTDNWREVLAPFADVVTVEDFPESLGPPQRGPENLKTGLVGEYRWVACIDIDEFLVPEDPNETLAGILKDYEKFPAIGVHWLVFGSSGYLVRPDKLLVIEAYTKRPPDSFPPNSHVKTILNPASPQVWRNPHFNSAISTVDTESRLIPNATDGPITHRRLRLNHYFTKSFEEWKIKSLRGGGDGTYKPVEQFSGYDSREVLDERAMVFALAVRETLRKRENARDL